MSRGARVLIATLVAIAASASTSAQSQSFGQIAKQEEARRATAKKAARSFSNDDLGPGAIASPPAAGAPAAACYQSISTGGCVTADQIIAVSNATLDAEVTKRREATWRGLADRVRAQLAKARESKHERSIADAERRWARVEADAEAEQVPRQWLEPIPTLSTRTPQ